MLPNVSHALAAWEEPTTIRTVVRTTTNFVESVSTSDRTQMCVVQIADKTSLSALVVDWSIAYIAVHTSEQIAIGEYVYSGGKWFKVIAISPWHPYGYVEAICEEAKAGVR